MKKITGVFAAVIVAITAFASNGNGEKETFNIDTESSKIYWVGKKVSGEHSGYLLLGGGSIFVKNDKVLGADVKMNMNSIEVTDLEGEWKDKLVGHLKNDDFFAVDKFPTATFKITSVEGTEVVGDLTIKGITHKISFPANVSVTDGKVTASGTASIDRTKWDIKYGSGKFFSDLGDRMIHDEFEIKFELVANEATGLSAQ